MNEIQLKSLAELLGKNFFIPNYQRGYRWDEQQVKDLLCDINNFAQKHPAKGEFYCLQPLVVRKMTAECKAQTEMLLPEEEWYEVVDGQQRLTTIYLILQAYHKQIEIMKLPTECFRLVFERGLDVSDVEGLGTEISMEASIDKYHLGCAFRLIKRFLDEKSFMVIDFCKALLYNNPVLDKDGKTINDEANNVRFIWYEIDDDEDTIEVFRNLNHGKISLTNSELVRALMLKSTNFGTETNETRLRQQEIAQDWDEMEYKLQDETFWSFLRKEPWTNPTRIEFIFDLICKQNALDINEETFKTIGEDRYRTFRYFYEYFQKIPDIKKCWQKIKNYYSTFKEWFSSVELYHYVGFLVENGKQLETLLGEWKKKDKASFTAYLRKEIKSIIDSCPPPDYQYKTDGSDKRKCRPILLFHNIQSIINYNSHLLRSPDNKDGIFMRFPFHLFKTESWDVEHINSNTTNDESDPTTCKEWLLGVFLSLDEKDREEIATAWTDEAKIEKCYKKFKTLFSEPEPWTPEEKNRLWNYTLLDSSTNRGYGNAIFSAKRRIILSKCNGKLLSLPREKEGKLVFSSEGEKAESAFIPLCTERVFSKQYSPTTGDSNYWTKIPDAQKYLDNIKDCIEQLKEAEENHEQTEG